MKKITILVIALVLALSSISANALTKVPKISLKNETITISNETYVEGTVSYAMGQSILLKQNGLPVASVKVGTSGNSESFRIKIPQLYAKDKATFTVKSQKIYKKINSSN